MNAMCSLMSLSHSLSDLARACELATRSLEHVAWSLPGRWPDHFVILKRADRTGVRELAFGGELWGYPRPVV